MPNHYQLNRSKYGTHQIISSFLDKRKTILDVGCNDGYLIKLYPHGIFTGIDYSAKSAKQAKKNGFRDVRVGDLNKYTQFNLRQKFQVLIFADILEHLLYPQKVLSYFVDKNLQKGGRVIVSLPNVANFTIRFNLLFGNFNYTDSGILDRTHLHLYTENTARQLLEDSGLKIISLHFSSNHFGALIKILPFLGPLLGFNLIFLCQKT